jgi:hypothetical protein
MKVVKFEINDELANIDFLLNSRIRRTLPIFADFREHFFHENLGEAVCSCLKPGNLEKSIYYFPVIVNALINKV